MARSRSRTRSAPHTSAHDDFFGIPLAIRVLTLAPESLRDHW